MNQPVEGLSPIVIVDYGVGNLRSIQNMLKKVGAASVISSDHREIHDAKKLILPGVGAFDAGMRCLHESGMVNILHEHALEKRTPILGVCLGMQLLTERSEEGELPGLGWIKGETVRFRLDSGDPVQNRLKVPHMGWNTVSIKRGDSIFANADGEQRFYFVHSYHVVCDEADALCTTHHGYEFVSAVQRDHIMGTQFHPEKSHRFGMNLLKNFAFHLS